MGSSNNGIKGLDVQSFFNIAENIGQSGMSAAKQKGKSLWPVDKEREIVSKRVRAGMSVGDFPHIFIVNPVKLSFLEGNQDCLYLWQKSTRGLESMRQRDGNAAPVSGGFRL